MRWKRKSTSPTKRSPLPQPVFLPRAPWSRKLARSSSPLLRPIHRLPANGRHPIHRVAERWSPLLQPSAREPALHLPPPQSAQFTTYALPFDATWQPDLFGRIRNTISAAAYRAQASAADLENTRLTVQADVAMDYFQLRGQDALKQLLDTTLVAYQESLDLHARSI